MSENGAMENLSRNEIKELLAGWIVESLEELGGKAHLVEVAKMLWKQRGKEIANMGDLLFTWQYDYRWAATHLRESGTLKPSKGGIWEMEYKSPL
jgi:hypothetical protein